MGNTVPAIERMDRIMSLIAGSATGASLSTIANELGIPKSTVHRLLVTMENLGYIEGKSGNGLFRIGHKPGMWAREADISRTLVEVATPFLHQLVAETRETAKLSVVRDDKALVVARVESPREVRITVDVGSQFPIHAGAASRVLLASLSDEVIARIANTQLARFTDHTIIDADALYETLARVRELGYAVDDEEYADGVRAVAAPVRDMHGTVIGAVSVPFIAGDSEGKKQKQLIFITMRIANAISEKMGFEIEEKNV